MKPILLILLVAITMASCNQPGCSDNTNEILNSTERNSWAYQHELMRLIDENPGQVDFYFERRAAIGGESFIVMNCYGPEFCGELKTKFVPKNVESIKLQDNKGWQGAQLIGVGFNRVKLASGHEVFALSNWSGLLIDPSN